MTLDPRLLKLLACPVDKGPLWYFPDEMSLYNPRERLRYQIESNIPVMLIERADKVDSVEHERLSTKHQHLCERLFDASSPILAEKSSMPTKHSPKKA